MRHEAAREAGLSPLAYIGLFTLCLLAGLWSVKTFGTTVLWPANAVLLAAVLQLPGRKALAVMAICFTINVVSNVYRGDPSIFLFSNAILNQFQVLVAAVLTRRLCGAALDMRRPGRLFRFVFMAVVPAVACTTFLAGILTISVVDMPRSLLSFRMHHLFDMEMLAMVIVTPTLLLLSQQHRFRDELQSRPSEILALMALVAMTAAWVFTQSSAPLMFMIFPPIILLAFRLSPRWTVLAVMLVVGIGGLFTLRDVGPVAMTVVEPDPVLDILPPAMRRMNVLHLFLLALMGTALPITTLSKERRRLIERLRHRTSLAIEARQKAEEANLAKTRFLALMSHELRTPLTAVTGYADLLSRNPSLNEEGRRQVEAVAQGSEAMKRLVEDVLEVARGGEEVSLQPVNLRSLVEEALAPSRQWAIVRKLQHSIDIAPDAEGQVMTDSRRLRQILHHLSTNAVKFTQKGSVRLSVTRHGENLRFAISDTGCGMSESIRKGVFRLFEQADASTSRAHEGAGVGLALAQVHTLRLGGSLSVESEEWRGSTFTLDVPAPVAQPTDGDPHGDLERRQQMRVLIVDDHPANRNLLRLMMEAVDCETVEAEDGIQAVQAVVRSDFDLILMDVRMPNMDGLTATRSIRALPGPGAKVAILAVTAEAMPEDAERCLAAGMDAHLAKPVTQAKLYQAINTAFEAAARRGNLEDKRTDQSAQAPITASAEA